MQMNCQMIIVFALACLGANVVQSDSTENELRDYLKHFNKNRHHFINPDGKTHTRDFIRGTFIAFGLHTWMESFVPSPPNTEVAKGVNVIGFLPGKLARTREDRLILIGSHYDTMRSTAHGANDNGSGVAALLRVAKLLTTKWGSCAREYSVMFVAFDFEEWENSTLPGCACAELGCGSRAFVSNISQYYNLFPNMSIARYGQLQGAIIMDTMMNYNSTPNTQHVPSLLKMVFPEQYNTIANNSFRGDFLVAVGRYSNDDELLNDFAYYYKKDRPKYKLQVFPLPFDGPPSKLSYYGRQIFSPFLRSDHISFWNEITSNRAIFLSDTANSRSYMTTCYHQDCDDLTHVTKDFLGFLSKSCDTIVMTTKYLANTKCKTNTQTEEDSEFPTEGSIVISMFSGSVLTVIIGACCCFRKKNSDNELVANEEHNWSAANPVYVGTESEGVGRRGSGSRRTGSTGNGNREAGNTGTGDIATANTGITNIGNRGTGNEGTGSKVRQPKEQAKGNIYEAVEPEARWNGSMASDRRPGLREPGKSNAPETSLSGSREGEQGVHDSIA